MSPSSKLFVGGLSYSTTTESLRKKFEEIGEVTDASVIFDRETNRSRGFGFVTFADDKDCQKAIDDLSGIELDGRTIRVDRASDRQNSGFRRERSGFSGDRRTDRGDYGDRRGDRSEYPERRHGGSSYNRGSESRYDGRRDRDRDRAY